MRGESMVVVVVAAVVNDDTSINTCRHYGVGY